MTRARHSTTEKAIQDAIIEYAKLYGVRCFRRNVGAVKIGPRFIRFASPGMSDLWGWDAQGVHFECEVKRHGGKASPEQVKWLDDCMNLGVHTALIENVDEGMRFIDDMGSTGDSPQYRHQWRER